MEDGFVSNGKGCSTTLPDPLAALPNNYINGVKLYGRVYDDALENEYLLPKIFLPYFSWCIAVINQSTVCAMVQYVIL